MSLTPDYLYQTLKRFPLARRYCVAFSGGVDSHVMLDALNRIRGRFAQTGLQAFHIDHGLNEHSPDWVRHCAHVCRQLDIVFRYERISVASGEGESLEASARHARYAKLSEWLEEGDILLTAHHQDDQAETILLQLLRGAGVHGLAAMPECTAFGRGYIARPLLQITRQAIKDYASRQQLHWIDDPSNNDRGFNRNYLRHNIMPILQSRWPGVVTTLARTAGLCADAARLLDEQAMQDIARVESSECATLPVGLLNTLDEVRQRNLLRYWVRRQGYPPPAHDHLRAIVHEVLPAKPDAEPLVHWPGCEIRRFHDRLYIMAPLLPHDISQRIPWQPGTPLQIEGLGVLASNAEQGQGLSASTLQGCRLEIRFRQGGEKLKPTRRDHAHSLKHLLQEMEIPTWERERIPLIYVDDELAAVADLLVGEAYAAKANEAGWRLHWQKSFQSE